jgi:hypothetical protein
MGYTLESIKLYIKNKINHDVVSETYKNTTTPLDIKCVCGIIYKMPVTSINEGYYHCNGKQNRIKRKTVLERNCLNEKCNKVFKPHDNRGKFCSSSCSGTHSCKNGKIIIPSIKKMMNCLMCNIECIRKRTKQKLCSNICRDNYQRRDENKEKLKCYGEKGGKISAHSQQRRSKNEIYFAELCETHFGKENVITNEPIFDGWDADVIIPSKKIAILWNGQWHYKQIMKSQSLLQVQTRDRIKVAIIKKYGYTPYIIKDMGKYKPEFVKEQFENFMMNMNDM